MKRKHCPVKYILLFVTLSIFTSSCSLLKKERSAPLTQTAPQSPVSKPAEGVKTESGALGSSPAENYINRFKNIAISEMNSAGIPASITLAQGILESGSGNSRLALEANNHFGIKCTPDWKGESIKHDDDQKDDCFRVYKSPEESFRDHSEFLKRKRYAALFELDKNDYKGWAAGLKEAGYATNPRYAELLINLIERYGLNHFDRKENEREKIKREDKVLTEIAANIPQEQKQEIVKNPVAMKIYEARSGDTLSSVSRQFSISIDDLKKINGLASTNLMPGQLLIVSK
jgi:flagellum-specific peptidoglycan hydrolase FlgJ